MRRALAIAVTSAALVAACGSDSSPETSESRQLPDADELIEDAEALGISPLALALDQTASAAAYRMQMSMGMDMSMGGLGQTLSFPADPATPYLFVDVDAEQEQHLRIEMGPMMDAMLGSAMGDGSASDLLGGDLDMEMWQSGSTMIMDVSGFGAILSQAPQTAGIFPADVFTIDLARLGEGIGGAEMASALVGQAAPDPVELLNVLRDQLDDPALSGDTFSGTIGFLDYATAFGQDPTAMTGAFGDTLPDVDLSAMFAVFDEVEVDVSVTVEGSAVDTIRFDVDLTPLFGALPEIMSGVAGDEAVSQAELDMMASMLEDSTFSMTMLLDYDLDPSIDVVIPTGDFPDATDQLLDGFGGLLGN